MKIRVEGVRKVFGTQAALDGASLEVEFEHTLALIGPSGGGKSTLLRVLAGLEFPDEGTVEINGRRLIFSEKELALYRRRIGVVFQAYNLFPHLTALENVMLPLEHVHHRPDARERALRGLEQMRLEAHVGKKPAELSGGQRQRVAIARALAIEPEFLLMDEPTSALDPEMTSEILDVIAELRERDTPLVLVTHEMGFARETADVVAFIADGKVRDYGEAKAFFENPQTDGTRRFLARVLRY